LFDLLIIVLVIIKILAVVRIIWWRLFIRRRWNVFGYLFFGQRFSFTVINGPLRA